MGCKYLEAQSDLTRMGLNGHELDSELGGSMTGKVMSSRIKNHSCGLQGEVDKSSSCVAFMLMLLH